MASSTCFYSTFLQRLGHSDVVWLLKPSGQQESRDGTKGLPTKYTVLTETYMPSHHW